MKEFISMYEYFKNNPAIALAGSVIFSIIIWLYKDSKTNFYKNYESKLNDLDRQLQEFYHLESLISYFTNEKNPNTKFEIYKKIADSNQYFSENLRETVIDYFEDNDDLKLTIIKKIIQIEIKKLREEKRKLILEKSPEDIFNYIINLFRPIKTMVIIFIMVVFSVLFVHIVKYDDTSILNKVSVISLLFGIMISLLVIYFGIERFIKILNRHNDWRYISLIVITFLAPFIILVLSNLLHIYWLMISIPFIQIATLKISTNYFSNEKIIIIE